VDFSDGGGEILTLQNKRFFKQLNNYQLLKNTRCVLPGSINTSQRQKMEGIKKGLNK
jgi:hypothetical protein